MTALLVKPLPFTVHTSTSDALYPASNANMDEPGLAWRRTGTTASIIIDLGATAVTYDTIALVGCNVMGANTIKITTGNSSTGTGRHTAVDQAFPGTLTAGFGSKLVYHNPALTSASGRYVKITFTTGTMTDAFIQVNRIIIGKSVATKGIDIDPELTFWDQSIINEGPGWTDIEEYSVLPSWKASISWVSENQWRQEFAPFFASVGLKKPFLFVPNYDGGQSVMQTEACFGRMIAMPLGKHPAHDLWTAEINMRAVVA